MSTYNNSHSKRRIGILSGSFNPIHIGHVMLASYISEFSDLDEIWLVVTPNNPLKSSMTMVDENLRLDMVKNSLKEYDNIRVSDIEFDMPRPSYTINTLERLSSQYLDCYFTLIIGADNWTNFYRWKDYRKILNSHDLLIYPRLGSDVIIPDNLSNKVKLIHAPIIEISSTFIRKSVAEGKDIRAFVPDYVYDTIKKNNLYMQ
ncbi:MAG: nicotinate (nicotinamide) nucleotide adenylyltransferase [Fermentimonas sp.]